MKAIDEFLSELGNDGEEVLLLLREASELVSFYRRLLERYELDNLTGLPGSNKYRDFLAELENKSINFGVIFFDVNGLKYYNDVKGHQAGDLLLQKAAESIQLACGINTHAFRIGGDEFVVVITNCTESDIDSFIKNWREKLSGLNEKNDGIHCSVAVGAAYATGDCKVSDILKQADEHMNADKKRIKEKGLK
jgi:diguanylate cyclase (GGDEF)-like protein